MNFGSLQNNITNITVPQKSKLNDYAQNNRRGQSSTKARPTRQSNSNIRAASKRVEGPGVTSTSKKNMS
jgi:hypothetical protein